MTEDGQTKKIGNKILIVMIKSLYDVCINNWFGSNHYENTTVHKKNHEYIFCWPVEYKKLYYLPE